MHIAVLQTELIGASPEIRYFLVAYIYQFGDRVVHHTVKELSLKLGVSTHVVSDAISYFEKRGWLVRERNVSGRGRPSFTYVLKSQCRSSLQTCSDEISLKQTGAIASLLKLDCCSEKISKTQRLSISNKLFLGVLLAHMDACGVVRSLGRSDLRRLTGMSDERLKSQLKKMLALGYVRTYVAGATHRLLFGAAKGSYYLNLPKLYDGYSTAGVIVFCKNTNFRMGAGALFSEMNRLQGIGRYKECEEGLLNPDRVVLQMEGRVCLVAKGVEKLFMFFNEKTSSRFQMYFQSKLNEYASDLLSRSWGNLLCETWEGDKYVKDKIEKELKNISLSNPSFQKDPTEDQWNELASLIYRLSLRIAVKVRKLQHASTEIPMCEMDHVIHLSPFLQGVFTLVVESHPKELESSAKEWRKVGVDGDVMVRYESEEKVPKELRELLKL
ncbi:helix-turn-helix domain-containing protein [Pontibacterium granulatum]|uniref:MarR family transcriptional regulator n=1 Tax=Pontibacterium granulatum TaxID=2036029 RepID=UPI00249C1B16|nr:helix-turn-helix domain-containing protein [Pontibacterium granulatum]MDI3323386.1 helix-turn-helix domain-containing protein [Pontibacterium granulatum]